MTHFEKITIIFHTRNRPEFLLRAIENIDSSVGTTGIKVMVMDASDEDRWSWLEPQIKARSSALPVTMIHRPASSPLQSRISEALPRVSTPYVLLAADDDLYFFDWLKAAVDLLDSDPSFGVVYGHTLKFEIEGFKPYSDKVRCYLDEADNPPARWLEGGTSMERLRELGNPDTDLATVGWYALQRTEILKVIADTACTNVFDAYLFEKFLIFCQAAMCRTRMLDSFYLARQVNVVERRPPFSFAAEQQGLSQFLTVCAKILETSEGLDASASREAVAAAFRGEIAQLKRADSKKHLRLVADRVPLLRRAWAFGVAALGLAVDVPPDPRFPTRPFVNSEHPAVKAIERIVHGGSKQA